MQVLNWLNTHTNAQKLLKEKMGWEKRFEIVDKEEKIGVAPPNTKKFN